ncbi:hypothetical protein QE412_002760 [Microbacterium trichothecenolyticum]|uniref:Uncharacterized protein n=1 Tax=Microbacterium trichothecenolyticum TaxID=69370 RepID=A0ABU0TZ07_MICTR|nr:hypothetical protein [Microbacterium trichothecenolyticum]
MPHLTSIDAMVLPLLLVDRARERGAAPETLQSVTIAAGSAPWLELDHVPVSVHATPDGSGRVIRARTGSFRTQLRLTPTVARVVDDDTPTVYGSAYRDIEVHTRLTSVTSDAVLGTHAPDFGRASMRASGIDGALWPGLTAITYVAIMGQLTQVALRAATGRGRRETGNLWMRRMSIDLSQRRRPSTDVVTTDTRVTDRRVALRHDPSLQTVEVRSTSSEGVVALASLAYREAS